MSRRPSLLFTLIAATGVYGISRLIRRERLRARPDYFTGKIILITGSSRGIGRALALEFARRGASLVLASRNDEQLAAVAAECEALNPAIETLVVPTDVTDKRQLVALINAAISRLGRIDMLVNNAGIVQGGAFTIRGAEAVRQQIEVNLMAAVNLTELALPEMLARGQGQIVNLSSVMARHALPYFPGYSASKHALSGFGEALRRELDGSGVRVLTAFIGFADTQMVSETNRRLLRPFGVRVRPVEQVARLIAEGIVLGRREVIIGGTEFLAEWITRVSPWLSDWMWREMAPAEFREAAEEQFTE